MIYLFVLPRVFRPAHKWLLDKKVLSENDRFEAEMNLSPNQKLIWELRDQLHIEVQRNNDLSSLKNSNEETIRLQKDQILRLENEKNAPFNINNGPSDPLSKAIEELKSKSLNNIFIGVAKRIITGHLVVGSSDAKNLESSLTIFFSLRLIERERISSSSNTEVWKLTELGNEILSAI